MRGALEGAIDAITGDAVYQFEGLMIDVVRGLLLDTNGEQIQLRRWINDSASRLTSAGRKSSFAVRRSAYS